MVRKFWTVVFAILGGCATTSMLDFEVKRHGFVTQIYLYETVEELRVEHRYRHPTHTNKVSAFMSWRDDTCELHLLQLKDEQTFYDRACDWGEELGHCVYGNFHGDMPFRGC